MLIANEKIACCPVTEEQLNKNYKLGLELGYPECCVAQFVEDVRSGLAPGASRGIVGNLSGFVPCTYHARLVRNHSLFLEDLVNKKVRSANGHGQFIEKWAM